ncbi:MAG: nicotinate-nucleotide--dimethylbenzimidazole phosphoribosyltransferase [Thermosediminibacterales bacterium]|nr:nicotinate-nucleotide--dimethylbenzimidazole phosphoribosyltransferase [Thermosediminibacterales bacterium]MDK2835781.1 nicotinate-nucleotide--dimethylbenzimidazole phosphoribosyltransferase [Thermosediminibacterales bacterium]
MLQKTIKNINKLNQEAMQKARQRLDILTKPKGSLGVLEDLAVKLAGITGNPMPKIRKKAVIVMAADHGVVAEGVSAFPQEVTPQMVLNFLKGGAAINVLSRQAGADVVCVDIGVASDVNAPGLIVKKVKYGTDNITKGPAMSRKEAEQALETGIWTVEEQTKKGVDLLGTGEMGIGNTTPSSAILAVYSKLPLEKIVGRGTGINAERLNKKIKAIEKALERNRPDENDPINVLAKVGGLEIAGLAGCILGAAANRIPIVIDGFISSAAALIAAKIEPKAVNYMIASHISQEPGHRVMLELIGLKPMLHMNMRLGEGTGAALAFYIVEASTKIISEMATFEDAGVSGELSN